MHNDARFSTEAVQIHLRDYLGRSNEARHAQRLLCVLLVAQGWPAEEVAQRLGVSTRSVERWMRTCSAQGVGALAEKPRPGRPPTLTPSQLQELEAHIGSSTRRGRVNNGRELAEFIQHRFGSSIGERQARRVLAEIRRKEFG